MLRLTNTLTGRTEEFKPLHPPKVTLYVCGVTVYDDCHIGHARGAVVFDVLRRFLESPRCGWQVTCARNITDVDDKIIDRARQEKTGDLKAAAKKVASTFEESFRNDFKLLGLLAPTHEPRATEFIPQMIGFIEELLRREMAYVGSDGVYFAVRKIKPYGKLSHQSLNNMKVGVRISATNHGGSADLFGGEPGQGKKDPLDFALWKKAKPDEPAWESRWGLGRPGWHIECSTMATSLLGDEFDIHGGGQDLIFPHHENEIAQAEGAGKPFARLWLHNGLLTVGGQKMSKSLGNFVTIGEALKRHGADVLRLFFLSAHYRSPLDFTWERFDEAAHAYERITSFVSRVSNLLGETTAEDIHIAKSDPGIQSYLKDALGFYEAMDDDLNTPEALASIYHLLEEAYKAFKIAVTKELEEWNKNPSKSSLTPREFSQWLADHGSKTSQMLREAIAHTCVLRDKIQELVNLLGFSRQQEFPKNPEIQKLVQQRDEVRRIGDYAKSDQIRRQLNEQGYIVEDTSGGTVVRRKI